MPNPYDVERTWPPYFLEHRKLADEQQGTYKAGPHPVWTVHVPDGWIGNSTIIEGDEGLIVYDTSVSIEAGEFIAAGIAYYGGAVLPPEDLHHHGGIALRLSGGTSGYIPPTHVFSEDTELEIAGIRLRVFKTGGEAISEFGIHLPEFDMVIIADEFFYGLPNVHSIRGSKPREPENYMRALDRVRAIKPQWLLGSHIIPIEGRDEIYRLVTTFRDATQFLWDQSIRLINKGFTPTEMQHALKELPEHLVVPPYTTSTYGTPFTSVPEFFSGWVSWFDGDATNLLPTEPREHARRFVALMGGADRVLEEPSDRWLTAIRSSPPSLHSWS